MTSSNVQRLATAQELETFADFPPRDDMQNSIHLYRDSHLSTIIHHLGNEDITLVLSEVPLHWRPTRNPGTRIPDLMIAFDVKPDLAIAQNGYSIREQCKPPDFVLEIAPPTTARNDYTVKREDYATYGVPEYWRFDPTGGQRYDAPLAGDQLVEGAYQPLPIHTDEAGGFYGYSRVLNLFLCWEQGLLRWWDPVARRYLLTHLDEITNREEAERQADQERQARLAAEKRIRELEEQLGRP